LGQSEQVRTEVIVSRGDWEAFLASLERLITLHRKTLQRLKDLEVRNQGLRTELRSAMALPTIKPKRRKGTANVEVLSVVRQCAYCGYEIETSAKFCDRCGKANAAFLCQCGRELGKADEFCDTCGQALNAN